MTSNQNKRGITLRKTKTIYLSANILMVVLLFAFVVVRDQSWSLVLPITAIVIAIAMTWFDYKYWRCPKCHEHIGRRMVPSPSGCKFCGEKFDYDVPIDGTTRPDNQR